jgi:hypothetical protein
MSLDKSQKRLLDIRLLAINSILFALEENPEVTSADYDQKSGTFCIRTLDGSYNFKLVFPGEILPRDAGHA